jgi:hypothetical protein
MNDCLCGCTGLINIVHRQWKKIKKCAVVQIWSEATDQPLVQQINTNIQLWVDVDGSDSDRPLITVLRGTRIDHAMFELLLSLSAIVFLAFCWRRVSNRIRDDVALVPGPESDSLLTGECRSSFPRCPCNGHLQVICTLSRRLQAMRRPWPGIRSTEAL